MLERQLESELQAFFAPIQEEVIKKLKAIDQLAEDNKKTIKKTITKFIGLGNAQDFETSAENTDNKDNLDNPTSETSQNQPTPPNDTNVENEKSPLISDNSGYF
ncbi:MAG: hypothetical protein QS2022_0600 [Candidatus Phytoplasma asteris]|uniref:Uncharacterized protein n=2 Tax=16SrI (Aster yellows group) TaxID=3042590 RepID=Q6YRH7_ONYPE|nr:hypothetical protein ['Chrysanthemum coronarium' phytoplasma]TKA88251.1 MAG: hypothetical protein PLY_0600 [Periwinkle leaf yellowing phytoplasma]WEX19350.1 MAG: hypothetical protein QS2022_0600 [Candidatus Phytoplasma asteris]BAD04123.1 hypothetical protein PAM_038 [Onion yellows phytoplasma OY-M]GAK73640.1 uncharacterized protein OYV_01190 ['Chrysanthemum coronarium' phytoplasma]